ncbi:MAG: class I SAM-dependent methyltransferase [Spirochaetaceae bacterium]|nr:class I SAM-dependent methyltransferase [Spirochaetaceae bacterium]
MRERGRAAFLFLPAGGRGADEACVVAGAGLGGYVVEEGELEAKQWGLIVCDRFKTPADEFARFAALAPVLGIDEGGRYRSGFDFLLDLLPALPGRPEPNALAPHLLDLPKNRKPVPFAVPALGQAVKILISFGAEGGGELSSRALRLCGGLGGARITLVEGALSEGEAGADSAGGPPVQALRSAPNLKETLAGYDLVVTHFGLTAFESLCAGTPVMLLSPTRYHAKLARAARLFTVRSWPFRRGLDGMALTAIAARSAEAARRYALGGAQTATVADWMAALEPKRFPSCPVCAAPPPFPFARFPEKSYRRCPRCKTISMAHARGGGAAYTDEYFFESYKRQYGKTYLEDFPNLTALARRRLRRIKRIAASGAGAPSPALLDVGCAYGAFLAAAQSEGFRCEGLDPCAGAVEYVRDAFGIPARQAYFPDEGLRGQEGTFDVVTLWYVIEHLQDPAAAIGQARALLKPGGVFAFSTPSASGASGRFASKRFLRDSPADHWTIWDPRAVKKILRDAGFAAVRVVGSGHHPERLPLVGRYATAKNPLLYKLCMTLSRAFKLGDTFEAYAVKSSTTPVGAHQP